MLITGDSYASKVSVRLPVDDWGTKSKATHDVQSSIVYSLELCRVTGLCPHILTGMYRRTPPSPPPHPNFERD